MKDLIEFIAKSLVDRPEEVSVSQVEEDDATVLELRVAPDDLGKVIGRQGRMARALRTLLGPAGMKQRRRIFLEIIE
ncbi:MAG TPA: KH domain-containing protein [Candidatus Polarisedimenticolia bacterium]|nr:KH domain-containing protein [Candidatus Polarisedimenticolia bacterium]